MAEIVIHYRTRWRPLWRWSLCRATAQLRLARLNWYFSSGIRADIKIEDWPWEVLARTEGDFDNHILRIVPEPDNVFLDNVNGGLYFQPMRDIPI